MNRDADYACSPEELWRGFVQQLRGRQLALEGAIFARVRPLSGSAVEDAGLGQTIAAVVEYMLTCIEQGEDWLEPVPSVAVAQARRAAGTGVGLDTIVLCYVAGHGALGESIMDVADRSGVLSDAAALRRLIRIDEAVLECLLATVAREYGREREREERSPARSRAELVHGLLTGARVAVEKLGYDLDAWHVCVIATGLGADKALRSAAVVLGRDLLLVAIDAETWAWLGGQRKPSMSDVERALSGSELAGVSLAISEPARGIKGWRLTHREAQAALLVAREWPRRLTRYLDVALEAAALQDEALAQSLMEAYLSPLDDPRSRAGGTRRRMLRAYFKAEHNASSTAAALNVDRSTVHRWLADVEGRLGCRLHERQAEIEMALRLENLREHHPAEGSSSERQD
jgi:GGDEF-like domain